MSSEPLDSDVTSVANAVPDRKASALPTGYTPSRRVFVRVKEVPALLLAALGGSPVALRRILGARRSGRIGVVFGLLVLAATATQPLGGFAVVLGHLGLSAILGHLLARPRGLGPMQHQRLVLWFAGPLGVLTAPLGLVIALPWLAPLIGVSAGHLLLARYLIRKQPFGESATETEDRVHSR